MPFDTRQPLSIQSARTINVGRGSGGGGISGQLILPAGNVIASRFIPLTITNAWADADCSPNSAHRNAYPGLPWDYLLSARGGCWPYYWEIIDGPTGLALQGNPTIEQGTGRLIFGGNYERLLWENTVAGNHPITVRCTDQLGAQDTSTFTLNCGTLNHVFINTNPAIGSNSNDGTINNPLLDDFGLHGGTSEGNTHDGKTVWVQGTFVLQGMSDANSNYRLSGSAPRVFRGIPGEKGEIIQRSWFVNQGGSDVHFSNLFVSHDDDGWSSEQTNRKQWALLSGGSRIELVDITCENYGVGPTSNSNPAHVYSSRTLTDNLILKNWDVSGEFGTIFNTYITQNSLFENLNVHDGSMINGDSSSNQHVFRLKGGDHYNTVMRGNKLFKNITWLTGNGGIGIASYPEDGVDICYNKVWRPDARALNQYGGSSGNLIDPIRNIHVYRNSFNTASWAGNNKNIKDEFWENNIFTETDEITSQDPEALINVNNIYNQPVVDLASEFQIRPEFQNLIGTHGADLYVE